MGGKTPGGTCFGEAARSGAVIANINSTTVSTTVSALTSGVGFVALAPEPSTMFLIVFFMVMPFFLVWLCRIAASVFRRSGELVLILISRSTRNSDKIFSKKICQKSAAGPSTQGKKVTWLLY